MRRLLDGEAPTVALPKELKLHFPAAYGAALPFSQERPKAAGTEGNSPFIGVVYKHGKWKVTRGYKKTSEMPVFPIGAGAARNSDEQGRRAGGSPKKGFNFKSSSSRTRTGTRAPTSPRAPTAAQRASAR